jgi:hypothetical protein
MGVGEMALLSASWLARMGKEIPQVYRVCKMNLIAWFIDSAAK